MLKEDRFRELIEAQRTFGLTIKEFYSNHAITRSTFHYWKDVHHLLNPRADYLTDYVLLIDLSFRRYMSTLSL